MKRAFVIPVIIAGALALGGCSSSGFGVRTPPQGTATTDPTVEAVQNAAARICGFVPTVSTVAGIITTFTGGGAIAQIVGEVATSICDVVVPKRTFVRGQARLAAPSGPPVVRGVAVQGFFLK